MAEISVGIDLGTTNSCISTCWPNGQPRLLRDDSGVGVIPSVVSFPEEGDLEVGHKARMRLLTDAQNTFYSTKRFIGRDMRLEENRWAASHYAYTLEAGNNGIPLAVTRDRKIPVYQISGHVLTHLKQVAEKAVDQPVTRAVITVPANFNEVQRRSTHQAGEFAGLQVLRIFNEPTAAALAYGLGKEEKKVVAVYDFGGGTFDITILRLEDPVFEVIATSGDMMLGGDDFDRLVLTDMFEQFHKEYNLHPEADPSMVQRFSLGAERMKCQLTDWIVTAFEDRHVRDARGASMPPFHYEINRDRFRELVTPLVDRSFDTCQEAFELAKMQPTDVDEVILVGGTTRIPFLRQKVQEYFGRKPLDRIQPDVVVSIGAAIQAYSLAGGDLIYPARSHDMLPIRKVEPRPPTPKKATSSEMELLDDLSEEMEQDEKESERKLSGGRTIKHMAVPSPSRPPSRPPRILDAKKTVPLRGTPSKPPAPSRASEPPSRRKGQTLRYAPAVSAPGEKPQAPPAGVDLPTPSKKGLEELGLPDPFASDEMGLEKAREGQELQPQLDEPLQAGPEQPGQELTAVSPREAADADAQELDLQSMQEVPDIEPVPPEPARPSMPEKSTQEMFVAATPSAPPSPSPAGDEDSGRARPLFSHPDVLPADDEPEEQPAFSHPDVLPANQEPSASPVIPSQADEQPPPEPAQDQEPSIDEMLGFADEQETPVAQPKECAIAPLHVPEQMPEQAPVVTPEGTASPYVPGDVVEAVRLHGQPPAHEEASQQQAHRAPLLLDVTPNTLGVATVGGFVEVLVRKNSPVPIEKAHLFTTSIDDQDKAVIKVLEGESSRADENHVLGEVELLEIRKAPRGEIKIEVTYEITVDGILQVSGKNLDTGQAQTAKLTLFGG